MGAPTSPFRFAPRWKEELVVSCADGQFILPFWMGIPTVDLPTEDRWREIAPPWARDRWSDLHRDLKAWCAGNNAALNVDPRGMLW